MIVFPSMLVSAATQAGMKVPPNPDKFEPKDFMHFHIFCAVQLCRSTCYHGEHFHNAEIITQIPDDKIGLVTLNDLLRLGLSWRT